MKLLSRRKSRFVSAHGVSCCVYEIPKQLLHFMKDIYQICLTISHKLLCSLIQPTVEVQLCNYFPSKSCLTSSLRFTDLCLLLVDDSASCVREVTRDRERRRHTRCTEIQECLERSETTEFYDSFND